MTLILLCGSYREEKRDESNPYSDDRDRAYGKALHLGHPDMNLFVRNRGIADLYLFDFLLPGGRADAAPCDQ